MTASAVRGTRTRAATGRPRSRITPRAAVLVAIVVVVVVYSTVPLRIFLQERAGLRRLHQQERVLEARNADLARQAQRLKDPSSVELIARQCLGMVRPGQIAFVVVPKGGTPAPPAC